MKKIPTLFKRVCSPDHKKTITREVTPGCECVLRGECVATVKWDGACCAIINGEIYKRYDAKIGKDGKQKQPPEGAIPCQPEPDPITGHWPHWVKCEDGKSEDKWFFEALRDRTINGHYLYGLKTEDGTYEAIGSHFNGNPYSRVGDTLIRHGELCLPNQVLSIEWESNKDLRPHCDDNFCKERSFDSIRYYLKTNPDKEGIVFWKDNEPLCKIKRSDFGFPWPPTK